jgi:iron only hydrogenase large subunit-like protein/uncharacterized Fe-S cluster-containing protein
MTHRPAGHDGAIVFTNKAHCRDCYRCLRVCPVKAIRMTDGQAQVVAERCIHCGTCIRQCPQGAKSYRRDVATAEALLAGPGPVAASVAPSFAAAFEPWQQKRLASALRRLGFAYVGETAVGAWSVSKRTAEIARAEPDRAHVCSSCPAVVNYVEQYAPRHVEMLAAVVSPMLAHAGHIRQRLGEAARVVFIGPCIGKKAEAQRPANAGLVDCVLTFEELGEWLVSRGIDLAACEESRFDETPAGESRLYPLEGGALRTAGLLGDMLDRSVLTVTGFDAVRDAIEGTADQPGLLIEPLLCDGGCINGPAAGCQNNLFARRRNVLSYAATERLADKGTPADAPAASFGPANDDQPPISESEIAAVLEKTGKSDPRDQLDCGACGYATCRDKAIAVIRNMADAEICIPHMRRLAERRTDRIIETSPNGIVILDEQLRILSMNPAFGRYFMCSEAVCGKPIGYLMDPHGFERLACGEVDQIEGVARHERYNLTCHQILYALRDEKQYVGIFVNITRSQADREKLSQLRSETMMQARELMEHQVSMAQTIARFLGESTARGEQLVENLIAMTAEEGDKAARTGKADQRSSEADGRRQTDGAQRWLRDTYTSK